MKNGINLSSLTLIQADNEKCPKYTLTFFVDEDAGSEDLLLQVDIFEDQDHICEIAYLDERQMINLSLFLKANLAQKFPNI